MNPNRFFVPKMGTIGPMMVNNYLPSNNSVGFLGKMANSIKRFNWSGLLNGANKTLNVVNQTIPLVRQAKPMVSNFKSVLRLTKMFNNETFNNNIMNNKENAKNDNILITEDNKNIKDTNKKNNVISNYPNFFV